MVQEMTEESKQAEASRFDQTNSQALKKMQDLQAELSKTIKSQDEEAEVDEFDSYMENALTQEAANLATREANDQVDFRAPLVKIAEESKTPATEKRP